MELPKNVQVLAATKGRSVEEIQEIIDSGIHLIGENYIQEAKNKKNLLKGTFEFHLIGHLQKNKVKMAVELFDMIQTVDSLELAQEINKRTQKKYSILIEVNSGREKNKSGVFPEEVMPLVAKISHLPHIKIKGLMTMGPKENPQRAFRLTKKLFDQMKKRNIAEMKILSMGMSDSYRIAIEEGATMVRLGRILFEGTE